MNVLKLSALASLVGISSYANAIVSGSADVTVTGTLNGSNQCTIAIDAGAELDAGKNYIPDLASTGEQISEMKAFNTTVNCIFPTAVAFKYSSSLTPNPSFVNRLGDYMTSGNKSAAHLWGVLGSNLPTAGGIDHAYSEIGNQDLSVISSADTFAVTAPGAAISSTPGQPRNAFTIIDSNNNPAVATSFVFPFRMVVVSIDKSSGWPADIGSDIFSLSATVTIELHTI